MKIIRIILVIFIKFLKAAQGLKVEYPPEKRLIFVISVL